MSSSHLIVSLIVAKKGLQTNQDLLNVEPFTEKFKVQRGIYLNKFHYSK